MRAREEKTEPGKREMDEMRREIWNMKIHWLEFWWWSDHLPRKFQFVTNTGPTTIELQEIKWIPSPQSGGKGKNSMKYFCYSKLVLVLICRQTSPFLLRAVSLAPGRGKTRRELLIV